MPATERQEVADVVVEGADDEQNGQRDQHRRHEAGHRGQRQPVRAGQSPHRETSGRSRPRAGRHRPPRRGRRSRGRAGSRRRASRPSPSAQRHESRRSASTSTSRMIGTGRNRTHGMPIRAWVSHGERAPKTTVPPATSSTGHARPEKRTHSHHAEHPTDRIEHHARAGDGRPTRIAEEVDAEERRDVVGQQPVDPQAVAPRPLTEAQRRDRGQRLAFVERVDRRQGSGQRARQQEHDDTAGDVQRGGPLQAVDHRLVGAPPQPHDDHSGSGQDGDGEAARPARRGSRGGGCAPRSGRSSAPSDDSPRTDRRRARPRRTPRPRPGAGEPNRRARDGAGGRRARRRRWRRGRSTPRRAARATGGARRSSPPRAPTRRR